MMISAVIAVVLAFAVSVGLNRNFCNPASRFHILDHPNERSLHTQATPRSGGVAILAGIISGGLLVGQFQEGSSLLLWLLAAALPVAFVSYFDDRGGVPIAWRFLTHLSGAALLVWGAGLAIQAGDASRADLGWLLNTTSLLYVVWMINLYNFMDGMDGFAGGMAVIGFGTFAVLGLAAGHGLFAAISLLIAAAAAGFLVLNFPPARIFMGDAGSSVLGLLAAALTLWAARDGIFPWSAGLLVFSPFTVDATVTLGRRLLLGQKIWQAHRTHYYQRLVQLGWGHRKTVIFGYVLMICCGLSAVAMVEMKSTGRFLMVLAWCAVYLALMAGITRLEKKI